MNNEYDIIYWNEIKDKLRENYPILTTADLQWRHGTTDELLLNIADRLGISRNELQEIIEKF